MLKGLFTRFGSQYREGGLTVGKFVFTDAGDTWARYSTTSEVSHNDMLATDAGTGLVTLTFEACRHAVIVSARIDPAVSTFGSQRRVEWEHVTDTQANAGSCNVYIYKDDDTSGVPGLLDPVDQSVLTVVMYSAK